MKADAEKETRYLLSIPGMEESIKEGMNTPIDDCDDKLTDDWDVTVGDGLTDIQFENEGDGFIAHFVKFPNVSGYGASREEALTELKKASRLMNETMEDKKVKALVESAVSVEKDDALNNEMKEWQSTIGDGLTDIIK